MEDTHHVTNRSSRPEETVRVVTRAEVACFERENDTRRAQRASASSERMPEDPTKKGELSNGKKKNEKTCVGKISNKKDRQRSVDDRGGDETESGLGRKRESKGRGPAGISDCLGVGSREAYGGF